jgi:ankyrin repeat protein
MGADPSGRGTFGGPTHGEGITALHLAAQNGDVEAIHALLAGGADPSLKDALFDGTPGDWAGHFSHTAAAELLAIAARPGG